MNENRAFFAACRVSKTVPSSSSVFMLPKKLSIGALSQQSPFRLMEQSMLCSLLAATERDLSRIVAHVGRRSASLRGKAEIGLAVGAVIDRHKMRKHYELTITDDSFTYRRKPESIAREAARRPLRGPNQRAGRDPQRG
jgi:hypothetical protein